MALVTLNFYSECLHTPVDVTVLLPEYKKGDEHFGRPTGEYKTVYLLHGMSADHSTWLRRTDVEIFSTRLGCAFVMPGVGDSWYTNTPFGMRYLDYVSQELPHICRQYFAGMSADREMNLVAGCSMGGYGAVKVALTHPKDFCACISLGGALDITRKGRTKYTQLWRSIFDPNLVSEDELEGTEHDLFYLAKKQKEAGESLPPFYLWCGESDSLTENNRRFDAHLTELGLSHSYIESQGNHSWKCWGPELEKGLNHFLK